MVAREVYRLYGNVMSLHQLACVFFWLLIVFTLITDTKYEQGMTQRKHLSFLYDLMELPRQWKPEEQFNVKRYQFAPQCFGK